MRTPRRIGWGLVAVLLAAGGVAAMALAGSGGASGGTATVTAGKAAARPAAKKQSPIKLTVEVNGDLLIHSPVWETALQDGHGHYDFFPMLREIAPYIRSADLAICHVETPMTPRPPTGYPVFNTPPALAHFIRKTGWRICATASNPPLDGGQYGIDRPVTPSTRRGCCIPAPLTPRVPRTAR